MNKKLIALAVLGACAAPAAMAQTANPVTLYGRVYVMFESVEAPGGPATAAAVPRRSRIADQASMFGIRGTEDLGGGLKAFFQLETSFHPDQNDVAGSASTFANRNSGVGLQGGWGSFVMGRWDTPIKVAEYSFVDPFGDLTLGGFTAAMGGSGIGGVQASFDRRDQNVIQYWSPSWAGFAVRGHWMVNEGKTATTDPKNYGFSAVYTGGAFTVGYAWDQKKDQTFLGAAISPKQTNQGVFGNATFGPVKVAGMYEDFKRDQASTGTASVCQGTIADGCTKQKAWVGSIVYTMGNNQFIYQYQKAKDGVAGSVSLQPECSVNAFGYQYNFTRRTFLLAQYARVENNDNATCNFGSNTLAIAAGQDPRGWAVGVRHIF